MSLIAEQLLSNTESSNGFKRRRTVKDTVNTFWESTWGKLLTNPNVENHRSVEGKRFRRRFRLPYHLFRYLVEL
jgi:hypothetical protein